MVGDRGRRRRRGVPAAGREPARRRRVSDGLAGGHGRCEAVISHRHVERVIAPHTGKLRVRDGSGPAAGVRDRDRDGIGREITPARRRDRDRRHFARGDDGRQGDAGASPAGHRSRGRRLRVAGALRRHIDLADAQAQRDGRPSDENRRDPGNAGDRHELRGGRALREEVDETSALADVGRGCD